MAKGAICPICNKKTFHDKNNYRKCSHCGAIGWSVFQTVENPGKGKGIACPNCGKKTLHEIITLEEDFVIRKCSICNFALVYKPIVKSQCM